MEYKARPFYVKAVADRTVTGIFSVFGNVDSTGDIVWPGSFSKTFQERGAARTLYLWQHAMDSPPTAIIRNLAEVPREALPAEVLAAAPDALGGAEVSREYLATPRGDEILTAIKAGAPLEGSYGFDPIKFDFTRTDGGDQIRNLREQKLYEVSDVLWGANDATRAAKAWLDLDTIARQLIAQVAELKTGARHSAADLKSLNMIHDALVDLGADCKSKIAPAADPSDADKSRAASLLALTQLKQALTGLEVRLLN